MAGREQILSMSNEQLSILQNEAITLLKRLIATPSFSKEEDNTADIIEEFLEKKSVRTRVHLNNIWATNKFYNDNKPTILLNSHHDTVKPNKGYTLDPFLPIETDGKLFGLGSNDAGGALVSLIAVFLYYYFNTDLKYNLIVAATAEEEISGNNGIEALLPHLGKIECGIVGEPTEMQMAVAEKGLMVLDCIAHGKAGHAAREEGENSIYKAMEDIQWIQSYQLDHPLVKAGLALERKYYGSPTTSDKALMSFPTLKMGPGVSARSHTADEYIYTDEIKKGIELYIQLLGRIV